VSNLDKKEVTQEEEGPPPIFGSWAGWYSLVAGMLVVYMIALLLLKGLSYSYSV